MNWFTENAVNIIIFFLTFMEIGAVVLGEMYLITFAKTQYMINVDHYHSVIRVFFWIPLIMILVIGLIAKIQQTVVTIMMSLGGCWLFLSIEGAVVYCVKRRKIVNLKAWNMSVRFVAYFVLDTMLAWFIFV